MLSAASRRLASRVVGVAQRPRAFASISAAPISPSSSYRCFASSAAAADDTRTVSPTAGDKGIVEGDVFRATDRFQHRHVGPSSEADVKRMLNTLSMDSLEELMSLTIPDHIRTGSELDGCPEPASESEALEELRTMLSKNKVVTSMIGMGYYGTKTPAVVLRNILENPAWYTAYTPYQAEVSQGRMEMLLNFQTMVADLTAMPVANCSLLDEGTSAGEAANMCHTIARGKKPKFFVANDIFPQTLGCVTTRCNNAGIEMVQGDVKQLMDTDLSDFSGVLLQYPNDYGTVRGDLDAVSEHIHSHGAKLVVATDLLACTSLRPPGEFGADIVVGSSQRFGVPMWFGGPHAGYMSCQKEFQRLIPGRLIGVSIDSQGNRALRMALQTREQFIKREKATSNICTAQALLANAAAAYGVYHGPEGLKDIATRVHRVAHTVQLAAKELGYVAKEGEQADVFFDTLSFRTPASTDAAKVAAAVREHGVNVRVFPQDPTLFSVSLDESTTRESVLALLTGLAEASGANAGVAETALTGASSIAGNKSTASSYGDSTRMTEFMTHPVFHSHRSETQMLRYITSLANKDITLCQSMIALGSCTMKLNATSELQPISWPEIANMHPFAPVDQTEGCMEMVSTLNSWLASITGFDAVSTQPNSGATGEYAGLLAIKAYHESRGDSNRNVCLIPRNAHGTNPASAAMASMKVVGIACMPDGSVSVEDLRAKAIKHKDNLGALMVTYPSTNGVFEEGIKDIIDAVHENGGQVYMDGANMNAQLGMCSPGGIGADVCHLNLHKTFAIPHGGGGPGVGSIGVAKHLAPFLPGHTVVPCSGEGDNVTIKSDMQIAAAPYGSAGVLPISWMYIRMMGGSGLLASSQTAILNANYMARRLEGHYGIVFKGSKGMNAHEFIVDMRPFKEYGIDETDIAKRLADYGFHAPTMSWPVAGTIMIEPTESEDKGECDRLVDALIEIRGEVQDVIDGTAHATDNVLKNAPHTAGMIGGDTWDHPYSRELAAFPTSWVRAHKFWPSVSRVDNVWGDRNLMCTCPPVEDFEDEE